jgi:hypothetical protein
MLLSDNIESYEIFSMEVRAKRILMVTKEWYRSKREGPKKVIYSL